MAAGSRLRDLVVQIKANTAEVTTKLGRVAELTEKVGKRMESVGRDLSMRVSLPLLAVGGASIKMAMDAQESENLFTVSMGNMEGAARDFSMRLREELGLNDYAVRRSVGTFQTMFESMGLSQEGAYRLSTGLTQLAADMASFYNLRTEDAFAKLQAGISGEVEPLKRLGILINETTIAQTAMNHGLIQKGQKMTEAQKVMARYITVVEATRKAQGDLARTQDSATNLFRRLREEAQRIGVQFGETLIPATAGVLKIGLRLVQWLGGAVEKFAALDASTRGAALAAVGFVAALGPLLVGIGGLLRLVGGLRGAFTLLLNPVGLTIAAVGTLAFAAVTLVRNWDAAKLQLTLAWTSIKDAVYTAVDGVLAMLERLTSRIPWVGDRVRELRAGFDELAEKSLANANERIADLERQIAGNFTPTLAGAAASADDFKLSLEGLDQVFKALGGEGEGGGSIGQADNRLNRFIWNFMDAHTAIPDRVTETYAAFSAGVERTARKYRTSIQVIGAGTQMMAQEIAGAFWTAQTSFREFAADFMRRIQAMIVRLILFRTLATVFGGFAGQSNLGGALFNEFARPFGTWGGARADGGPIYPGRTYLVGERGPELIHSKVTGTVTPLTGGQSAPVVNLSFDLGRIPAPRDPLSAARDSEWVRFLGESLRAWSANGGRLAYGR